MLPIPALIAGLALLSLSARSIWTFISLLAALAALVLIPFIWDIPPFAQLKINRTIATRYDQLANSFLGMVHLATARYWLKFVHAA